VRTLLDNDFSGADVRRPGALAQDSAADYPNRPIKIIVCVPAGGGVDTVTRIVAEGLHRKLGQPVHR
jgi:tripartite-type tricarboxylate transporter receptor subunit TctC